MPQSRLLSVHGRNHPGILPAEAFTQIEMAFHNYPILAFKDIYSTVGAIGLRLGSRTRELSGESVRIRGYMAPPDMERSDFFVLTRAPVITCPFCDPGMYWPDDVVLALLQCETKFVDPAQPIEVVGELELGAKADTRTSGTRMVRLCNARWQPIQSGIAAERPPLDIARLSPKNLVQK